MSNPVIAEVTRGGIVESRHRGAYAVVDRAGQVVAAGGGIAAAVYPRSGVKAFQCLPVIEAGAAGRFGFTEEEIALCCSSHNGEPDHVRVARAMLAKAGNAESLYECGAHWPSFEEARFDLIRNGEPCGAVHNNCSGKHAGMLALARQLEVSPHGYVKPDHPVQQAIARRIGELCGIGLSQQPVGIDGCSAPTWAIPLQNLAMGFARFADPENKAARRIIDAVRKHPFMVAGTGDFDTLIMEAAPRLFIKTGAEGVYCACIPHAGLGIALKIDDGAARAAEVGIAAVLSGLDVWTPGEKATLERFRRHDLANWRKIGVGEVRGLRL
ncbi:asparaginase [Aestuariivirga sp.]|uniref:asparaginase n=1 Tax=Aestuariivirga sp. TaxID=2650926 RepID=UPI0025B9547C|nr:asparaginase [Aestuariivirga sp.]MCA3556289.1 asparaginase [Aestuariivirga sp.]